MRSIDRLQLLVIFSAVFVVPGGAAAQSPGQPSTRNENLEVRIGGRIHRMIQGVFDGASTTRLFTDAEQGPTVLQAAATGRPTEDLTIGATLEIAMQQNRPFLISQDKAEVGLALTGRVVEAFVESRRFGKASLGRGFAASWLSPEIDLTTTQFAALLPVGMLSPGLKFVDRAADTLSAITVSTHFVDVERLLIQDRVRYDSPSFGGVRLSSSLASDSRWDLALRTRHQTEEFTVVGGTSYADNPFEGIDWRWDVGASVLHQESGVSLTGGFLVEELDRGSSAPSWVAKVGWLADLVPLGQTAFAADYFSSSDLRLDGDFSESVGLFAVQHWPEYSVDFYVGVRRYDISRPDIELRPLLVVPVGVVLQF